MINMRGGRITVSGPFFTKDTTKAVRGNVEDAIDDLAHKGAALVQGYLRGGIRAPTGFTEGGVYGGSLRGRRGNPFGAVYMKPGLSRGRGSAKYPPSRVPYIVATVLETGHYGGSRVSRAIKRSGWQAATSTRRAIHQTRNARNALVPMVRAAFDDLAKGLR